MFISLRKDFTSYFYIFIYKNSYIFGEKLLYSLHVIKGSFLVKNCQVFVQYGYMLGQKDLLLVKNHKVFGCQYFRSDTFLSIAFLNVICQYEFIELKLYFPHCSRSTCEFPSRVNLSGPSLYCIQLYGQDQPVQHRLTRLDFTLHIG